MSRSPLTWHYIGRHRLSAWCFFRWSWFSPTAYSRKRLKIDVSFSAMILSLHVRDLDEGPNSAQTILHGYFHPTTCSLPKLRSTFDPARGGAMVLQKLTWPSPWTWLKMTISLPLKITWIFFKQLLPLRGRRIIDPLNWNWGPTFFGSYIISGWLRTPGIYSS